MLAYDRFPYYAPAATDADFAKARGLLDGFAVVALSEAYDDSVALLLAVARVGPVAQTCARAAPPRAAPPRRRARPVCRGGGARGRRGRGEAERPRVLGRDARARSLARARALALLHTRYSGVALKSVEALGTARVATDTVRVLSLGRARAREGALSRTKS